MAMIGRDHIQAQGFTLVELLITMLLAGLIMAAVYSGYRTTSRVQVNQLSVVDMQQNIRAAMTIIENDLRMAGYDPSGLAGAGFCTATQGAIQFTKDENDNNSVPACGAGGQPNENITLGFAAGDDGDGDGVVDDGFASFGRNTGGGFQAIAEGVSAVEFNYILDNDISTLTPTAAQLNQIVKVQVSLLARADRPDSEFINNQTFTTGSGKRWGPFPDNFRRRMIISTIKCRNMGI